MNRRRRRLVVLLGVGRATIYNLRARDPSFPKPVKLTPTSIAWRRDEVVEWAAILPVPVLPDRRATAEAGGIFRRGPLDVEPIT